MDSTGPILAPVDNHKRAPPNGMPKKVHRGCQNARPNTWQTMRPIGLPTLGGEYGPLKDKRKGRSITTNERPQTGERRPRYYGDWMPLFSSTRIAFVEVVAR